MIVFDASAVVSAALKVASVPERALLLAEAIDLFALSAAVEQEIVGVLNRPKFAHCISAERRAWTISVFCDAAVWFDPPACAPVCRDPKDDKYLDLALAAGAEVIVSGDDDLLVLSPWRGVRILRPAEYIAYAEGALF